MTLRVDYRTSGITSGNVIISDKANGHVFFLAIRFEIFIFIFGLCIGSFLNVCIYRLPVSKSIVDNAGSPTLTLAFPVPLYAPTRTSPIEPKWVPTSSPSSDSEIR